MTADGGTPTPDSITFQTHGLTTGDYVSYHAGGGLIGGLGDGRVYGVIVVDGNTLRLGATFSGIAIDADSIAGGITGIDSNRAMVRFAAPHHLQTGDAVIYRTSGSSISSDFGDGAVLYVRYIDANTVELYTSYAAATSAVISFTEGSVTGNQIATASFGEGDRVTYRSAPPLSFRAGAVDVTVSGGTISGDDSGA